MGLVLSTQVGIRPLVLCYMSFPLSSNHHSCGLKETGIKYIWLDVWIILIQISSFPSYTSRLSVSSSKLFCHANVLPLSKGFSANLEANVLKWFNGSIDGKVHICSLYSMQLVKVYVDSIYHCPLSLSGEHAVSRAAFSSHKLSSQLLSYRRSHHLSTYGLRVT